MAINWHTDFENAGSSITQLDLTGTVDSGGGNIVLFCFVAYREDTTGSKVSGITWDQGGAGEALSQVQHVEDGVVRTHVEIWRLINPTPGASKTLRVSFSTTVTHACVDAIGADNVNQSTPIDTSSEQSNSGNLSDSSLAVTSATGNYVIDVVCKQNDTEGITVGGGQTEIMNRTQGAGGGAIVAGASYESAGDPSTTMSWTWGAVARNASHLSYEIINDDFTAGQTARPDADISTGNWTAVYN